MKKSDYQKLIKRLDQHFIPNQIGYDKNECLIVGRICEQSSEEKIKKILSKENYDYSIKHQSSKTYLRLSPNSDDIVINIPKISRIHWILLASTFLTTLLAGALMQGAYIFLDPSSIFKGVPFSLTLMLILGTHEFGHYYYAQKHNVDASLTYFIPAPPFIFLIGTFGAFIKIKSVIKNRAALLQIGAAGPIAGFIVAVPALLIGLKLSSVFEKTINSGALILGDSLLMKMLIWITHPNLTQNQDVLLHPIAFAGWIGLLVTMLNLLPIGQLDGGHITYAMFGHKQSFIAKIALVALIPLSFLSLNWLVWGLLIIFLMRSSSHPPIDDFNIPLSNDNKIIGYLCFLIFILCFIPAPFKF